MASHKLNMSLKTVGGLLLVLISCLVVAMLGYHAYEGFSEGARPQKGGPRQARIKKAQDASGPSTSIKQNVQTKVDTSSGLSSA